MAGVERGGHKPPYPKNSMERRRKEGEKEGAWIRATG